MGMLLFEVYLAIVTVVHSLYNVILLPIITDVALGCSWIYSYFFSFLLGFSGRVIVGECLEESQLLR